jgi:hypothetical protein
VIAGRVHGCVRRDRRLIWASARRPFNSKTSPRPTCADSMVACRVLYTGDFEALERHPPALAIRLLHNRLPSTAETTVRPTTDVAALEG